MVGAVTAQPPRANAAEVESLSVPPPSMGRNITGQVHSWGYWGGQLQAMKPDIQRVLGASPSA